MLGRLIVVASSLAVVLLATLAAVAPGAVLVYDGFEYGLGQQLSFTGTGGEANPSPVWAGGIGFDDNSPWGIGSTSGTGTHLATIVPNLSFSSLVTAGNAVNLDAPGADSVLLSRPLNVSLTTGTLWGSYLYRPTIATNVAVARLNSLQFTGATTAKFQNCGAVSGKTFGGVAGGPGLATNADGPVLASGNTYLLIAKFDNLGQTGLATWWALSEANFTSLVSAGISEANLSLYCTDTVTATGQASQTLTASDFLHLYTYSGVNIYDEVRFGTSLADVAPIVPEPATLTLLAMGLGGVLAYARKPRN